MQVSVREHCSKTIFPTNDGSSLRVASLAGTASVAIPLSLPVSQ
jgi:hypothetical protein